jgi:spectinomycin phosphotransferase
MYTEPTDVDVQTLVRQLERHWSLSEPSLDYLPVGFGSYHWRATGADGTRHFVSVDDLAAPQHGVADVDTVFGVLDRAFAGAAALAEDIGLGFVVAPTPDDEGRVLRRLDERHTVRVEPYLEGLTADTGAYESPEERRLVATALGRLHAVPSPSGLALRDDLAIPSRPPLEEALDALDVRWNAGPFGEHTRSLLRPRADELRRRLFAYDEAADRTRHAPEPWVVTHGEPHRANVIVGARGDIHLVDWDTVRVAPRERDLRMVLDDDGTGWKEYVAEAGPVVLRPEVLDLYREWWDLAEVAIYVAQSRSAHQETKDTLVARESLNGYLL